MTGPMLLDGCHPGVQPLQTGVVRKAREYTACARELQHEPRGQHVAKSLRPARTAANRR